MLSFNMLMDKTHITLIKPEVLEGVWLEDLIERVRLGDEDLDGRIKGKQVLNVRRDIDEHCASTMRESAANAFVAVRASTYAHTLWWPPPP
jgi:hypothetical protein